MQSSYFAVGAGRPTMRLLWSRGVTNATNHYDSVVQVPAAAAAAAAEAEEAEEAEAEACASL